MDYCATYPSVTTRYHASDMILHVDSDSAYLVAPGEKSRIAGHYFLSNEAGMMENPPFHVICKILCHVVASAAEAETAGTFFNAQEVIYLRRLLIALGHPQPPTILKTDSSTTASFVNENMRMKRSKSWDMRYHWLYDPVLRREFIVRWGKGILNKADYYIKHFRPSHHERMRPTLLISEKTNCSIENFRFNPARSKIRIPARTVVPKTTRTSIILPRAYLKSRRPQKNTFASPQSSTTLSNSKSLTSISPVINKIPMTLQG